MKTRINAFSLIELLVVIAIVTILLSILIPTVARVRQQADASKCASNLRQIGFALHACAAERAGYGPLAGLIIVPASLQGGSNLSAAVGDASRIRYDYVAEDSTILGETVVSFHVALARYLGVTNASTSGAAPAAKQHSRWEVFTCPRARPRYPSSTTFLIQFEGGYSFNLMHNVPMDFALNDAVFGYGPGRLAGKLSKSGNPSRTLLLADAAPLPVSEEVGTGTPLFWSPTPDAARPLTLADAWAENGRVTSRQRLFDPDRHGNRANVLYVDGHVALENLTVPDLTPVIVADW